MDSTSNVTMKRISPVPSSICTEHDPLASNLLWMNKEQQQHPSAHMYPIKSTVRVNSYGVRHKFDGKEWRSLCTSSDGSECRNLAFRASLCQKHFYKLHRFKRTYRRSGSHPASASGVSSASYNQPTGDFYPSHPLFRASDEQRDSERTDAHLSDEDDSIEILENNNFKIIKPDTYSEMSKSEAGHECSCFSIDCDSPSEPYIRELQQRRTLPSPKMSRTESLNHETDKPPFGFSIPKITESIRLGLPPLTRTEEKSLVNELITQLPTDASLSKAEQIARRRACEIVMDNYAHQLLPINITGEWFYDFLLRNPRLPIHFQFWFSSVKATLPSSDQIIDIKIWELGLVTRSVMPSSSHSIGSSSP